ncbi:hypothetical protein Bpfe_001390 [Biomphalaria pfeifferi]|uniref:Ubiquitin-like domain-containing protein n=1 Tax=Biomphalaria pfeifferi TaxID=112525 RepID=A0AAD8CAP1_BIOPF|nr:hypothetical protein Bpfe_001390 [Biomphalaria pfeifferi]
MSEPGNIIFEAAPDIEVVLTIMRPRPGVNRDKTNLSQSDYDATDNEANINISRTILELKLSLGKLLDVEPTDLRIFKDTVELQDAHQIMDYEIQTDDKLTVYIN